MKAFKSLYLKINGRPFNTTELVPRNNLIVKKHDKENCESQDDYKKYIKQINRYGNIFDPVIVSKETFTNKYVIRGNIAAYFALVASNMANIPVVFINNKYNIDERTKQ